MQHCGYGVSEWLQTSYSWCCDEAGAENHGFVARIVDNRNLAQSLNSWRYASTGAGNSGFVPEFVAGIEALCPGANRG